ncbi:MAG: hypothetical protein KDH97_15365 [Calditrichaeota bacterium]|nr:hypothetical protein [Calditrichota bacterium]
MPEHIFSIGLVPVQAFISEARRSRDLRAGSAILSWVMREILRHLQLNYQAKLLIPHESILENPEMELTFAEILADASYSIPNRASGKIEKSEADLKSIFQDEIAGLIRKQWETLFHLYFTEDDYPRHQMDKWRDPFQKAFEASPDCPIELLWVVAPYDPAIKVAETLANIDQLYSNIKRTRPVHEWQGKNVGKCDQCGRREAVSPYDNYAQWWKWQQELAGADWVQSSARIDAGERLCMVCFTKRFAGYAVRGKFPSTSGVAAGEWQKQLSQMNQNGIAALSKVFNDQRFAVQFEDIESLIYNRTVEKLLKDKDKAKLHESLSALQNARRKLKDYIHSIQDFPLRPEPSNYLAVLTFDGDSMGKRIREKFEQGLPEKLIEFSRAVLDKYEKNSTAKVFYVGGDEGLILNPIETVLDVAFDIGKLFQDHVKDPEITLSMGITLFDRERPLGGAIRLAHEALETAKRIDGKNALSVTVQTASGNEFSATASWKHAESFWPRIRAAVELIRGKDSRCLLSMGWAYEIEAFLNTLQPGEEQTWLPLVKPATVELKRITLRKLRIGKDVSTPARKTLQDEIWHDKLLGDQWLESFDTEADRQRIANALHLIAFLCRESAYQIEYVEEPSEGGRDE